LKVIWFSSASDNEFDMTAAVARHPDIDLTLYLLTDFQDKNNAFHRAMLTEAPNIKIIETDGSKIEGIFMEDDIRLADLVILRHPTWVYNEQRSKTLGSYLVNTSAICTTWEWVPNLGMAQMPPLTGWPRIATTNYQDYNRAKLCFPEKQILYFPFGVVDRQDSEIVPKDQYQTDLVCDAQPHYECKEYNAVKRHSVDAMVGPAVDGNYNLALWGSRYGDTTLCDWGATEKFKKFHRGHYPTMDYPSIYASSKIYLGVSWNYSTGGFSIRLARALSCGIMTIWHKTEGGELDIPEPVLEWSNDYHETKNIIKYYMTHDEEREELARKGREWAVEHLEWGKQLKRLAREIQ
jgi:Glycosyl transferases group 1